MNTKTYSGNLMKRGPTARHGWKLRWFSLQGQFLRYYKKEGGEELGVVQLSKVRNLSMTGNVDGPNKALERFVFSMDVMQPSGIPREFVMCALDDEARLYWVVALQDTIAAYRTSEVTAPTNVERGKLQLNGNMPPDQIMHQLAAVTGAGITAAAPESPRAVGSSVLSSSRGALPSPRGTSGVFSSSDSRLPQVSPGRAKSNSGVLRPAVAPAASRPASSQPVPAARVPPSARPPPPTAKPPPPVLTGDGSPRGSPRDDGPGLAARRAALASPQSPPLPPKSAAAIASKKRLEPVILPQQQQPPPQPQQPLSPRSKQQAAARDFSGQLSRDSDAEPEFVAPAPPPPQVKGRLKVMAADEDSFNSSGYDTEEVVKPFVMQHSASSAEERVAAYDYVPEGGGDQMDLCEGDVVVVESSDGEWVLGVNTRTGVHGWAPESFFAPQ